MSVLFFWLQTIDLAKERVKIRVLEGGHYIDDAVIERRYKNGISNLFNIYLDIVDEVMLFDNSEGIHHLMATKKINQEVEVIDTLKFNLLKKVYHEIG